MPKLNRHPAPQWLTSVPHHPSAEQQYPVGHDEPKSGPHLLSDVLPFIAKVPSAIAAPPIGGAVCETVLGADLVLVLFPIHLDNAKEKDKIIRSQAICAITA